MSEPAITARSFRLAAEQGGWIDLSGRAKFRLTGSDRVRYLNGQVTNDVRKASASQAIHACVTNVKGKFEGDVFIHVSADGSALLLDAEAGLREHLAARLERYIVADDVELADVTDEWRLWHGFGGERRAEGGEGRGEKIEKSGEWKEDGDVQQCAVSRLGAPGIDFLLPSSSAKAQSPPAIISPLFSIFSPLSAPLTAEEAESLRILRGIPRWPQELNSDTFPPEAGLEDTAMDFSKGCYIGQEILSRIRTTGKMPRQLVRWEAADPGTAAAVGERLFISGESGPQAAGTITSAAWHPVFERWSGLAFLKQGMPVADSRLLVGTDMPRISAWIKISPLVKQ